jgi:hypothetical protein
MPNAVILDDLFEKGLINLERGALFDRSLRPKPTDFDS